jgi:hypothetical protein
VQTQSMAKTLILHCVEQTKMIPCYVAASLAQVSGALWDRRGKFSEALACKAHGLSSRLHLSLAGIEDRLQASNTWCALGLVSLGLLEW